jgi:cobalamin biosynthesis protein CobT
MKKFNLEDRLRSFAKIVTGNYKLKVIFAGDSASINAERMMIPPLEDTPEAFSIAKFLVAHESGHDLFSELNLKADVSRRSMLLGDILNSLEDARIEKLMTDRFEGLQSLFEESINRIISQNDYDRIPLSVQVLHGLYMMGKGYDTSMLSDEAKKTISPFQKEVTKAISAKNSREVLKVSEMIYQRIKHLEKEHVSQAQSIGGIKNPSLPDTVIDSLEKHKVDPDYDNMGDFPLLKDENVDESETEMTPDKYPLPSYLALIRNHTKQQSYLIQHLKSIIETKRRRSRKKAVQYMQASGSVDTRRLWKLSTGDDKVMKQKIAHNSLNDETDPDSLAVYVLLDESFSMKTSDRIQYAREAVAVLGEVLNDLNIPFAITGYTVRGALYRYLYKHFDEDYIQVRTRLVGAIERDGTYTQEHILYAVRKINEIKKRKKILIVVTDAEEVESDIRLKKAIETAKESDIELLGLGISTKTMQNYFDRFVVLENLDRFGEELLRLLRGVLIR